VGGAYVSKLGPLVLFRDRGYNFTLTREGIVRSIKEVAKLVVLNVKREYEVSDSVPALLRGPLMIGGRKTILRFVVSYNLAFDVSKIRPQDVTLLKEGDTLKIAVVLPEPEVMVSIDRWWVVSEEVGIFGTPMRSYEASPVFNYIQREAKRRMKKELPIWYAQLSERFESVMSGLIGSLVGKPVVVKVKGFRVVPQ